MNAQAQPNFVVRPNYLWWDQGSQRTLPRLDDNCPPNVPGDWVKATRGFVVINRRAGTRTSLGEFSTEAAAQTAADSMNGTHR